MQKITTFLWFDTQAEEAMSFYIDVFNNSPYSCKNSKVEAINRYPEGGEGPMKGMDGKVLTGVFTLEGQKFMCLDGGPIFKFNESISLIVDCKDQAEIDYFWEKLSTVPESEQCGWCKDKYGLSWQITPGLEKFFDMEPARSKKVMDVFLQMKKIDIAKLEEAAKD